jgi:hypothetical protein
MIGEIQPMVGIKNRRSEVKEQNRPRHTRFFTAAKETHSEENAPKEAEHHRQRYNPLKKHF